MCRKGSFFVYFDGEMLRSAFSAGSFWHSILFIYQPCMQESNALTASSYLSYIWLSNFFHGTSEDLVISILINFLKKLLPQTWIWFWVAHFVFKTAVGKKQQRHGAKRMEVRCISKTQFYFLARTGNVKGGIMVCEKTSQFPGSQFNFRGARSPRVGPLFHVCNLHQSFHSFLLGPPKIKSFFAPVNSVFGLIPSKWLKGHFNVQAEYVKIRSTFCLSMKTSIFMGPIGLLDPQK